MQKFYKWFFVIAAVALYLNIGWAIDYKWHEMDGKKPVTVVEQFMAGPNSTIDSFIFSYEENAPSLFVTVLIWPVLLVIIIITWIIYFIFLGGIARAVGLA